MLLTTHWHCRRLMLPTVFLAALVIVSPAASETNLEQDFTRANNADFTGTYEASGMTADSTDYAGTVKLTKWSTITTPQGNILQQFKMDCTYGGIEWKGVAIFDGHYLYYANGVSGKNNYYLMVLSKLELSQADHSALISYKQASRNHKEGQYVTWKGDTPWYGHLSLDAEAYGYWFWIDGIWGQYSTRGNGFPHSADSGSYFMLELKKNGEFGKMQPYTFPEGYWSGGGYNVRPDGQNVIIDFPTKKGSNWGCGMMTTHPVTGDSILVAMIGGPVDYSFGWYEISGNKFVGTWSSQSGGSRGTEEWTVPVDVLQKNAVWFK